MSEDNILSDERREYCRIPVLIPVVISISYKKDTQEMVSKFQGFTKNISETGLCLEMNDLDGVFADFLVDDNVFHIELEVPYRKDMISSEVSLSWNRDGVSSHGKCHFVGVSFLNLTDKECLDLFKHAKSIRNKPYIITVFIVFLITLISMFYYGFYYKSKALKKKNDELRAVRYEMRDSENKLISYSKRYYLLEKKINQYETKQNNIETSLKKYKPELEGTEIEKKKLSKKVEQLSKELEDAQEEEQDAKIKAGNYLNEKWKMEHELKRILEDKKSLLKELSEVKQSRDELKENLISEIEDAGKWVIYNIVLKNGITLTGELIHETDLFLKLKVGKGVLNIDKSKIQLIREVNLSSKVDLVEKWKLEEAKEKTRRVVNKYQKILIPVYKSTVKKTGFTIRNRRIYKDNKLFYIKGIGYGIEYPMVNGGMGDYHKIPASVFEKDFKMMAEAGINVIRTYEPLNKYLLDLALKYHIFVVENICYPTGLTDFSSYLHRNVLLESAIETVYRHKNHKAILMWSIWNDAPWIWAVGGSPFLEQKFSTVNDFLKKIYHEIKKIDPEHLITASNVIGYKGSELGFDFLDVLGFNEYLGGMDCYVQEDADSSIKKLVSISKKYDKPVVIWETGCSTYVNNLHQDKIIYNQIKTVGENLAGVTIFQWADGWNKAGSKDVLDFHIEEHWGILTGYRKEKDGFKLVKKIFHQIPTESKGYKKKQI